MNRRNVFVIIVVILVVLLIIGVCLISTTTAISYVIHPSTLPTEGGLPDPDLNYAITEVPIPTEQTLDTLNSVEVPVNDPIDLARRLEGNIIPASTGIPPQNARQVGEKQKFWVLNADNNKNNEVQAVLRYVTDHLYFWIAEDVQYNEDELIQLSETFEDQIYPTNREFFGSEWTPGIDGDPHLYILYAKGLGGTVAGYFSPGDEFPAGAKKYSNSHEMFLLSAERMALGDEYTSGVLAHEFQHMIHWYRDLNEETWMNEGFAEVAVLLNGYSIGGADLVYTDNPDLQITDWPADQENTFAHYGAAFLFLTYFLDRFGDHATQSLVGHPENGLKSIDILLSELNVTDPMTGKSISADDVFADWVVASYLQDETIADGRFTYHNYPEAPLPSESENIDSCPKKMLPRDVNQYGVDYISITCLGEFELTFEGASQVPLLPADPHSGSYAFYSNRGDESDMTLTRSFDFSGYSGPITLSYWTWFDIEEDYDYLYLTASIDGENWEILQTPSGTLENPSGNSYGWAYTGSSGGGPKWIRESVDLSQYAGEQVDIRFEYITDAAANEEGFLIDDISIDEINYYEDFERGDGDWKPNGFVRIQNILPQTFQISVISLGDQNTVERIEVSPENKVKIPLKIGDGIERVVLVVSGTTRHTRQKASYNLQIMPK